MSDGHPEHLNYGPVVPVTGFPFTAESPLRRYAEPAGILLLPAIAGYTIMDDKVAAGVQQHSEFMTKPITRLIHTANSALTLVFGNEDEAYQEAARLHSFHQTVVRGREGDIIYEANDTDLQTWVLACVTKGIEEVNWRWTNRAVDREGLWQDVRTFGTFFGVQPDLLPADVSALDAYWKQRVADPMLLRTMVSRQMAHDTFRFKGGHVPKPLLRIGHAVWVTSLDETLQERAKLEPTTTDKRIAHVVDTMMKQTYARIPEASREKVIPRYLAAARRVRPVRQRLKRALA
jgi:uncharacterized protein (DUF2236 family)